jgi:Secretion system C-terminal sorting domain
MVTFLSFSVFINNLSDMVLNIKFKLTCLSFFLLINSFPVLSRIIISYPNPSLMSNSYTWVPNYYYTDSEQSIDLDMDGATDIKFSRINSGIKTTYNCPDGKYDAFDYDLVYYLPLSNPNLKFSAYYPAPSTIEINNNSSLTYLYNSTWLGTSPPGYNLGSFHGYYAWSNSSTPNACVSFRTSPSWQWQSMGNCITQNGYLGFKWVRNGITNYGYLYFTVQNATTYSVQYAALETIPGYPIKLGDTKGYFGSTDPNFNVIRGNIFNDINQNCVKDAGETGIPNLWVYATNANFGASTDASGNYEILVNGGSATYNITLDTLKWNNNLHLSCLQSKSISVSGNNQTYLNNNIAIKVDNCLKLNVSIISDRRRRCFENNTRVNYSNVGLLGASNTNVKVVMPSYVKALSSKPAWNSKSGDTLFYNIGTLNSFSSGSISIVDSVICGDESIRGKTVCTKAFISPKQYCAPSTWDESDITLSGLCNANQYTVQLKNSGLGNMADSLDYRIFLDSFLVKTAKYKLNSADTLSLVIPSNGKTVRVEADQDSSHPELKQRAIYFEGCGNGVSISTGKINLFSNDPSNIGEAVSCMIIRDSYDPNEKVALPEGPTVLSEQEMLFTIRFQNTGTDTAYSVVVADTLYSSFDPATINTIASSHPYKFELTGKINPRMAWIFGGIKLPDSTTNERASHGFVTFKAKMKSGLANGVQITNQADIYFDYNSSIRTNKIIRTIGNPYPDQTFSILSFTAPDTVCQNSSALISVTAKGSGLSYNWQKDGTAIPAVSSGQYKIISADSSSSGEYKCMVKSLMDSIEVKKYISVRNLPSIISSPVSAGICETGSIKAGIQAIGSNLKYQWFRNGNALTGEVSDSIFYSSFLSSQSGIFYCKVYNACTFVNSNTANLDAYKNPLLINSSNEDLCEGILYNLFTNVSDANSTAGTLSYWTDSSLSTSLNNPAVISNSGTYYILKISDNGCKDTSWINLNFHQNPITTGLSGISICEPGTANLVSSITADPVVNGTLSYFEGNQFNPVSSPSAVNQTGEYYIIETSAFGCKDTVHISVNIFSKPDLQITNSPILCNGQSADLSSLFQDLANTTGATSYWTDSSLNTSLNNPAFISNSGTYYILKISGDGCSDTSSINLNFHQNPITTGLSGISICEPGTANLVASVTADPVVNGTLSYFEGNQFNPVSSPSAVNQTGEYYIIERSGFGCADTFHISVNILSKPDLQTTSSAYICNGQSVDLSSLFMDLTNLAGTTTYHKQIVTAASCSNITSDPSTYFVIKTTAQGCSDTTSLDVIYTSCTSILSNSLAGITVYPNPVLHSLIITAEKSIPLSIEIFDLKGVLVFSSQTDSTEKVDFSGFLPGLYMVHVFSGNYSNTYSIVKN